MKICINCFKYYDSVLTKCSSCRFSPETIDEFVAYAPNLALEAGGFDSSYFDVLAALEDQNFWFRARNRIILWSLKKYAPNFSSLLEIGCGTGFVLSAIFNEYPNIKLTGSELFVNGLSHSKTRLPSTNLLQMDAREIPFINEFDVIGAFDVLEHIKQDEIVLGEMHKALKRNGLLLLTVPQHAWLWSVTDEYAKHERRYSESEIANKLGVAGFKIVRSTSFVTTLLPALIASRLTKSFDTNRFDPISELKINPLLNFMFERLLQAELAGIKLGLSYSIGGSRLIIARKNTS